MFDDVSNVNDPDSPTTISNSFPQGAQEASRDGNEVIDAGSLQLITPSATTRAAERLQPPTASNFLIVDGSRSTNGHPLFVGGPQIGYYYPGLTLEADISWGKRQVRGIYSPAHPGVIFIGRDQDFAWSLTSAGTDNTDTFVETLCGGSDTKYTLQGQVPHDGLGQRRRDRRPGLRALPDHGPRPGHRVRDGRRHARRPLDASARPTGATRCG